ncbi:hypothetical protein JIN84_11590 [Luteolibacter yonseiensis]|uniref:Transmembrane protein n=1 Tax=Luteolibacter yonseiensis TaxID=1144680 RepID=A0A934R4I0_9BACT|nr:hypothetical protein [Luteolibacter yonseiensis]MBK1816257.1 hypothetical protein [Luteolibacter yonseiensis]
MTPEPSSSTDGSALPPRHRPNLGNLAKDTTETDLWAFDDIDSDAEATVPAKKPMTPVIPSPRDLDKSKAVPQRESPLPPPPSGEERIRVNVNKTRNRPLQSSPSPSGKPGNEFDDLDHWEDPEDLKIPAGIPTGPVPVLPASVETVETKRDPVVKVPESAVNEEVSPIPAPAPPPPAPPLFKLDLTKTEFIGIVALSAVLLIGGGAFFWNTIHRLPTASRFLEENRFPVVGKLLTVVSAENYWRAPAPSETVRRGTQLIPVVKLRSSGGPAAVRVFFRDAEGKEIGDTVTRLITEGKEVEIAATAGFDDVGMHSAYRTGQSKPWTIDILEAPGENSSGKDFQKLLRMNISAARR